MEEEHLVNDKNKKRYHKEGTIREVAVFISVNYLGSVNTATQTFRAQFDLQLNWLCTEEDEKRYKEEPLSYKPDYVPDLVFPNGKNIGLKLDSRGYTIRYKKDLDRWNVKVDLIPDLVNECIYTVEGTFIEVMELQNFPVDCQDLTIVMELHEAAESSILVPNFDKKHVVAEILTKYYCLPQFDVHQPKAEFAVIQYPDGAYSTFNLRLKLERKYHYYVYKVVLFLFIIGLASLCVFAENHIDHIHDRLSYLVTMLLAAIAFQLYISSNVPAVPYNTLLDIYILFYFIFIFLLVLGVSLVGYLEVPDIVDRLLFWSFLISDLIFNAIWSIHVYRVRIREELPKLNYTWKDYKNEVKDFTVLLTNKDNNNQRDPNLFIEKEIHARMSSLWNSHLPDE